LFDWAQAYLSFCKNKYVPKVYKEKQTVFRLFFKEVDPYMPTEKLTPAMVLGYIQKQQTKRSGNAANKDRKNLVAAWNWGMKYFTPKLPSPNPCLVEKMSEKRHPRYVPPLKDFLKVLSCVDDFQDKIMLLVFFHLAARRGEVFRLKVSDLDFTHNRIRLFTRKRKNGDLEPDWLPMTLELRDGLEQWLDMRPIDSEYVFICLDQYRFCRDHYGEPFQYRLKLMKRLCEKAKVKPFGFHAIRHMTATWLFDQGYSLGIIQALLRHSSPSTTERYLKKIGLENIRKPLEELSLSTPLSEAAENSGLQKAV